MIISINKIQYAIKNDSQGHSLCAYNYFSIDLIIAIMSSINDNDLINDLHMTLGKGKIDWQEFKRELELLLESGIMKETPGILIELKSLESFEESIELFNHVFN